MKLSLDGQTEPLSPVAYARAKGLSLNYVYTLLYLGRLRATKIDGKWRIPSDAVPERGKHREAEAVTA